MSQNAAVVPQVDGTAAAPNAVPAPLGQVPAPPGAAAQPPAPAARFGRAPRTFAAGPAPPLNPGQPDLLRLVRNTGLSTIEKPQTSTYVPSFTFFFALLALMDQQLLHNFSFGRSAPHWHPFISQAYFGVIVQIHVIRVMRGIIPLPPAIHSFLQTFEETFPLDSILIPGPLVPLLESITAFEGNFSNVGNVCANFATLTLNAQNFFCYPNGLHMIWPNVFFVLDQIRHEAATAIPANFGDHRYFTNIFGQAASAAGATQGGILMQTPHGRHTPYVTQPRLEAFRLWINRIAFPSRATITATINAGRDLTLSESLMFESVAGNYLPWFAEFAPIMAVYARHFEGTVSMSRISTRGLGAASLIASFTPGSHIAPAPTTHVAAAGNVVDHYTPDAIVSTTCNVSHNDPTTEELAEQYAKVSLINVNLANSGNGVNVPGNGLLRQGPYWAYPSLRFENGLNIYPGLPLTIRDFYVKERVQ